MTSLNNPPLLIVGLGNPDSKLLKTRHNIGFWFLDLFAEQYNLSFNDNLKKGYLDSTYQDGNFTIKLLKPMTFINDSGSPLVKFIKNTNINPKDIIVAYDDLDLSPGKVRLKFAGGSGGHNGVKDIIEKIGTKDFWRLKIGIGKPIHKEDVISYVLGKPSPEDKESIKSGIDKILAHSKDIISGNYTSFMNNINGARDGV